MFTLAYKDLRSEGFVKALAKIESCTTFTSSKKAYDIGKMTKEVLQAMIHVENDFVALLKDYAIMDDAGRFVPADNKPDSYQIKPDKFEDWKKVAPTFGERTIAIKRHKVDIEDLSCVGLSPGELNVLEPILIV